jgi:pyruvate formate lyase activating enzyme
VLKLCAAVQSLGVHTAVETNGQFGDRLSDEDLDRIDLVMLGLKAATPELHQRLTGMDLALVHIFARRLAELRRPVWVRYVVVPGWTDGIDEARRMADFAAALGNVERVDELPFHQLGSFKWERLGMDYQLRDASPPARETVEEVVAQFRAVGLQTV